MSVTAWALARRWCAGALMALAVPVMAEAQESYPSRPVQLIVPYPPGGNTDLMARALQPALSRALGQSVVIVNRGGASGSIGDAEIARARPDGYTIGLSPNTPLTAQPHLVPLSYSLDSFRYLCLVYDNPQVLILAKDAPFRDIAGMVAYGRRGKEALVYGSPGQGSTQHILIARLLRAAGVEALHVPFTGAGPMAQAAMGGQIMGFVESPSIPVSSGLPVAGVFSAGRIAALPEAPTMTEAGYPIVGSSAGGLVAPAGLPDSIAEAIQRACKEAVGSESFATAAGRLNSVPSYLEGAEFRTRFAAESESNRQVLRDLGIARE
ncbi:Bug family tripartite tricarboxylate transporter substrate binding protein [Pararoseomonas indoligenes]|uniref:Tripartite tricarboxylate transporter substrate binding protein n=1 Tax=Roseomonas indoligenes TaxID=2820811 RepID=A0A940MWY8_9PROT|nr:tripartite tricarboxylate transporter substrate binding protein [Pararoseomonas indoligenes]MBP0493611.1 tripartite tricarboxylate transporter substrate binding protein [Pararoseomonas indoligenes]